MSMENTEVIIKLNDINRIFYSMFMNIDTSLPISPQFDKLWPKFTELISEYNTLKSNKVAEIKQIEIQILNYNSEQITLQTEFNSKFDNYKQCVSQLFGRDIEISNMIFSYINLSKSDQRFLSHEYGYKKDNYSDIEKQIFISIAAARRIIENIGTSHDAIVRQKKNQKDRLKFKQLDIVYINQIIQLINEMTQYYQQLIDNYRDVLILTNKTSCLFQVEILDKTEILTIDQEYYESKLNESEILYMDVYLELEDYYYGDCKGKLIPILKTNCIPLGNPIESAPLDYLMINDKFIQQLLLTDKCNFLLFENIISKPAVYVLPGPSVMSDSLEEYFPGPTTGDLVEIINIFIKTKYNEIFNDEFKNYYEEYENNNSLNYIKFLLFNHLLKYLTSNNSFHMSRALQNFKCLFTHSPADEIQLYNDIDTFLLKSPDHRFRTKKLIDLFIPEIKFLTHIILYKQLQIPNKLPIPHKLQIEWEKYVGDHSQPVDTLPNTFLQYLLNVVLTNLVPRELYSDLLSKIGIMTKDLTIGMTKIDGKTQYDLTGKIIERVLQQYKFNQKGGEHIYIKNISRKKKSRKILNNKIMSRQKKIIRKN